MRAMTPRIVPFFLSNADCPNQCVFCNRGITAGASPAGITPEYFGAVLERSGGGEAAQVAFYGGDFTGLDAAEQERLLSLAGSAVASGKAGSIRISCRPDTLAPSLGLISRYPVRTIEIGAQSMSDEVLLRSKRGHTARDVRNALILVKEKGFESGIHIMAGLPGDTPEGFRRTADEIADMRPDMVRIHPAIVLAGTELAEMLRRGEYRPLGMEEAVECCRYALLRFEAGNISVIRIGLQTTPEMERPGAIIGGPFHPAFRSLVTGSVLLEMALELLEYINGRADPDVEFVVSPADVSDFHGIRNCNLNYLRERHSDVRISIRTDPEIRRGTLLLRAGEMRLAISRTEYLSMNRAKRSAGAPYSFFNVFI
ncbi:MAG TPA: radical SAM protein [Syntrophales bacterium]|nr:radical SAM protein [Syntrophales bacterium]